MKRFCVFGLGTILLGQLAVAGELGDDERLDTRAASCTLETRADLTLDPGAGFRGSLVQVAFRDGAFVPGNPAQIDRSTTFCFFTVRYGDKDFSYAIDHRSYPLLILKPSTLTLKQQSIVAESDPSGSGYRTSYVEFDVNPRQDNPFPRGANLVHADGSRTDSVAVGFDCAGTDIRVGDVARTLSQAQARLLIAF
jgi:hypothetical protein